MATSTLARSASAAGTLASAHIGDRAFVAGTGAATALAVCVAGVTLTREPLWQDEVLTVAIAGHPLGEFLGLLPGRQNGILFDLALWPIVQLGGTDAQWVRLPALLAFGAAAALAALVGARLASRSAGLVAAFLLALHPFAVFYAQEARPYTFVVLFTLLAAWTLLRALERASIARWLAYGLSTVGVAYSHDLAIVALLAHPMLLIGRARRVWLEWTASLLVTLVPALAVLLSFVPDDLGSGALQWVPEVDGREILTTLSALSAGKVAAAAGLIVLAAGSAVLVRRNPAVLSLRSVGFVAIWLIAPLAVLSLVSLVRPVLVPRFAISGVPALCLALGMAVTLLRPRLGLAAAAVVAAAFLTVSIRQLVELNKPDWPGVAADLQPARRTGEPILVVGDARSSIDALLYYTPSFGVARDRLVFSENDTARLPKQLVNADQPTSELARLVGGGSFWLVRQGFIPDESRRQLDSFLAGCTIRSDRTFRGDVRVEQLWRCARG